MGKRVKSATVYSDKLSSWFIADDNGVLTYEVTPWGLYINARRQYDTLAKVAGKEFYFKPQQWGGGLARNKWSYSPTASTWYYSDINGFLTKSANQTSYKENGTQRFDIIVDINDYKLYYETVQNTGILARNKWSYSPNVKSWYYSDLEGIILRITKSNPNPLSASELSKYNNRRLDFWFRASAPYSGRRNGIGAYEQSLMDKYDGVWIGYDKKEIYLTMDLGYEYLNNTTRILDIASEKNIKITFFVTDMFL